MAGFCNRIRDLARLNTIYKRDQAQMLIVYGRRRVGKTALLRQWITANHDGGPHLMWTAHRTTGEVLLTGFSEAIATLLPGVSGGIRFETWEAAFRQLFTIARERKVIVILDEFPYLVESVSEIPSLLQKLWDEYEAGLKGVFVLCGSHYHMMHEQFASSSKPLYGRATENLVVEPIPPDELPLFLPNYSDAQRVETWSVVGGVPGYLRLWNDRKPVPRNIDELLLSGSTFFAQEAAMLIQDEIAEPRTYLAILEVLGANLKTPAKIAEGAGIAINHIGKYLSVLVDLRFVRRVLSEDAANRSRSRNSRYEIRDPYLRFHFEFLYPNSDLVQQGRWDRLRNLIDDRFAAYVGKTAYEALALSRIQALGDAGELPFIPEYFGRAWTRKVELDVVAISWKNDCVLVGECKWIRTKMSPAHLQSLKERAALFPALKSLKFHYALFSRSGFTRELETLAESESVLLFSGPLLSMPGNG